MMIMPQKKKIATIFVSKLTSPKNEEKNADFIQRLGEESSDKSEYETPDSDASLAKRSAARSILRALERKDEGSLVNALEDFIYLCEQGESELPQPEME